jgi:hypothetical protein
MRFGKPCLTISCLCEKRLIRSEWLLACVIEKDKNQIRSANFSTRSIPVINVIEILLAKTSYCNRDGRTGDQTNLYFLSLLLLR